MICTIMFTVTDSICSSVHIGQLASFPGSPRVRTSDGKLGGAWEQGYRVASFTSLFLKGLLGWVQGYIYQRQLMVYLRTYMGSPLCHCPVSKLPSASYKLVFLHLKYRSNQSAGLHGLWKELHEEYEDDCSVHFQPIAPSLPLFSKWIWFCRNFYILPPLFVLFFWHAIPKSLFGISSMIYLIRTILFLVS